MYKSRYEVYFMRVYHRYRYISGFVCGLVTWPEFQKTEWLTPLALSLPQ